MSLTVVCVHIACAGKQRKGKNFEDAFKASDSLLSKVSGFRLERFAISNPLFVGSYKSKWACVHLSFSLSLSLSL